MYKINIFIKRLFDITISLLTITLLTPLWLVVSILIKYDSKGPIFFKQNRRTKDGKVFKMLKFRSMYINTEFEGAGLFNYENDPRVTIVGRYLRKTSIDELPQLFNVLKGDLSLVGPRPCVEYELGDFDTLNIKYKKRFRVKGGITGLAQCKGRNNITWDEKVVFDNEYIELFHRKGVLIDIIIMIWTLKKIFHYKNTFEQKYDSNLSDIESAKIADEETKNKAHARDY